MTDKIIAAAREAGFQISDQFGVQAGPMVVQSAVERLYAIAYRQGLEDAENAVRAMSHGNVRVCADAIRELMKDPNHG